MASIVSAGTTSATSLNLSADTSGVLQLASNNGTVGLTMDTSQNVGIGTSSPSFKIQAIGSTPSYFGNNTTEGTQFGYASALPTNTVNCFVGWIPDTVGTGGVNGDLALQPRTSAGANIRFFTGSTSATERMRIDSSGQRSTNIVSTVGTSYSTLYPAYDCRAWVNFNGTGTPAIRASGNVSSITDGGTGTFTINFTTAMPDANYACAGTAVDSSGYLVGITSASNNTASNFPIRVTTDGGSLVDPNFCYYAVFR